MNETGQSPSCSRCGTALAPDALKGLCPRCLIALNLAAPTEIPGETGPHGTRVTKPPPPLDEIARHFPQFEILECLGRGGMGVVYKARQPKLNRIVALKILAPEKVAEPKFAERFEREAQALARLNHPNIVTVYDFGETDGLYYLTMEFVDGASLRQLLQTRKIAPEEALAIVPKICEALQFAHEQGVVHRDIKPENVLLDKRGRVKIADFGIAKIVEEAGGAGSPLPAAVGSRTSTGAHPAGAGRPATALTQDQILGTPNYMAPEQMEHPQTVDHRADIYSLGVVFYEMLTGELPLGKFQPPSRACGKVQIDVRLDEIVLRALEKEPELRYQQASVFRTDVETVAATPPSGRSRSAATERERGGREEAQTEQSGNGGQKAAWVPLLGWRDRWLWERRVVWVGFVMFALLLVFLLVLYPRLALLAAVGLGFTGVHIWVGRQIRQLKLALPHREAEIAEGWIAWKPGLSPFRRYGRGLAILHQDRLELLPASHGTTITVPLADIVQVREVRWVSVPLFWKRGFTLHLANGQQISFAVPEPFGRRWRARLSRGKLPELPSKSERQTPKSEIGTSDVASAAKIQGMVKAPAMVLFIVGCLNFGVAFAMLAYNIFLAGHDGRPPAFFAFAPLILLLAGYGVIVIGASRMRLLTSYGWAMTATLCGMFLPIGCIIGLPVGIWSLIVLNRREVSEAFGKARILSPENRGSAAGRDPSAPSEDQSRLTSAATTRPKFSRMAIVGAVWAVVGVVHATNNAGTGWVGNPKGSFPLSYILMAAGYLTAPVATTIIGWIAVSQIRRSAGKLYGMWLAVFNGLLFPLLALDAVMIGLLILAWRVGFSQMQAPGHADGKSLLLLTIAFLIVAVVLLDVWIIRRVWRKVNQPLNGEPQTAPATRTATPQKTASRWDVGHVGWKIAALVCGLTLLWFAILKQKQREVDLLDRQIKVLQGTATRSQHPPATSISKNNHSAVVYHDNNVSLSFVLFHAGRFGSRHQDTNMGGNSWLDNGTITLLNGRTFGYRRESWNPERLEVNGKEYDLRAGRVLVLRDDGTVEQLSLFPSLAAARDLEELSRLIAAFAEPPKLRFLAWQGESPLGNDWKAWRPDGTSAESTAERDVLKQLILQQLIPTRQDHSRMNNGREVRVMKLWFSHPGFDRRSQCSIHLTDPAGKVIPAFSGSTLGEVSGPRPLAENHGWFISGFAPTSGVALPPMVNARLDYSLGKWTDGPRVEVRPKANATISMPHVVINTVGDTVDGKAFVSLVRDLTQTTDTQYDFCAETKDGRVLDPTGGLKSGTDSAKTERFEFDMPIREIKEFRLRTRKIKSVTFTNVVVQTQQPLATTQNHTFGPVMESAMPNPPAAFVRPDIGKDLPLKQAIDEFNAKFPDVQPLTEAEVIAAVRSIKVTHPDLPDSVFRVFQRVVDEHLLPKGMYFNHTAKFRTESGEFEVDWKDLTLDLGLAGIGGSRSPGTVFNKRIRTRFISAAGAGISPATPLTQSSNKLDVAQVNIQDGNHEDIPLALAIAAANTKWPDLRPPLTETEVIAAVSAIKSYIPDLPDSVHAVYERIVKERVFPKGMHFGQIALWGPADGHNFNVDWRDLILDCDRVGIRGFKPGTHFVYRIRARYISAW